MNIFMNPFAFKKSNLSNTEAPNAEDNNYLSLRNEILNNNNLKRKNNSNESSSNTSDSNDQSRERKKNGKWKQFKVAQFNIQRQYRTILRHNGILHHYINEENINLTWITESGFNDTDTVEPNPFQDEWIPNDCLCLIRANGIRYCNGGVFSSGIWGLISKSTRNEYLVLLGDNPFVAAAWHIASNTAYVCVYIPAISPTSNPSDEAKCHAIYPILNELICNIQRTGLNLNITGDFNAHPRDPKWSNDYQFIDFVNDNNLLARA